VLESIPKRQSEVRRGPHGPEPGLSQALGVVHPVAQRPQPGELCLDLGSSPGGWTLGSPKARGARVISVDKAPLDSSLAKLPGITHRRQSAFALDPLTVGPVDWLFSDVICYPRRLLSLMQKWLQTGQVRRLVCSVFKVMREFGAVAGSRLLHLRHNEHELTWICLQPRE
jgi:23S rRNA (cytidine2498-2'-O)-methyltransferase